MRMFARRTHLRNATVGTDIVVMGVSLPRNTIINSLRCDILITHGGVLETYEVAAYGVEAWILPVLNPEDASTYDTIWDTLVPKDTDVTTIDEATGVVDTTPFYEPGEVDWTQLFDVGLRPEKLYGRYGFMTIADPNAIRFQDNQTPFATVYKPAATVRIRTKKRRKVHQPSVLVVGVASPALDDTTAVVPTALAENEWFRVQYAEQMMEDALYSLYGLTEAGAETPYEESVALLQKHLEPDLYEETATRFQPGTLTAFAQGMLDHSVEGTVGRMQLTTGR